MNEVKAVALIQRSLLVKSVLLSVLTFGIVLGNPALHLLQAGAHKICQLSGTHHPIC